MAQKKENVETADDIVKHIYNQDRIGRGLKLTNRIAISQEKYHSQARKRRLAKRARKS